MRRILIALTVLLAVGMTATAAMAVGTLAVNFANAPGGTHFTNGTPTPTCTVDGLDVTCPTQEFELNGVGNTNATATLTVNYSATVDCRNHGGNIVESHTQSFTATGSSGSLSPDNGRLAVPPITVIAPTDAQFEAQATCPNRNWTPELQEGSPALVSFLYSLSFVGVQTGAAITITGP
jgi:hypothetical protein